PLGQNIGIVLEFSANGEFLLTGAPASTSFASRPHMIWAVPPTGSGNPVPEWLLKLATIFAAERLGDDGAMVPLPNAGADFESVRQELESLPADAPYITWGRWIISDRTTRSIAPGFTITKAEAAALKAELGNSANPYIEA